EALAGPIEIDALTHLGLENNFRRIDRAALRQTLALAVLIDAGRKRYRLGWRATSSQRRWWQIEALVGVLRIGRERRRATQQVGGRAALFRIAHGLGYFLDRIVDMPARRAAKGFVRWREIFVEARRLVMREVGVLHDLAV